MTEVESAALRGARATQSQRWSEAAAALEPLLRLAPESWPALENLALAWTWLGRTSEARPLIQRILAARPDFFVARLLLGFVDRSSGDDLSGMLNMEWAFEQARARGFWRDARSTQPWLRPFVTEAVAFVNTHRNELALRIARDASGGQVLPRVESFVRGQFGLERLTSSDPRQQPKTHFFPGLPASPWFEPGQFPWAQRLRDAYPDILAEYTSVIGGGSGFEPFLVFPSADQVSKYLGTSGPAPEWNAFFFYRHGVRNDANCARCPKTAALLDELPLTRIPGFTPEVCFSVLTPGSHILPHRGDSNLRSVVHLGLVLAQDCALKVAGEERGWEAGGVLAFDDTYEHEAWNRSNSVRAILLMDAWNPALTEEEKAVLPSVFEELNRIGRVSERLKPAPT